MNRVITFDKSAKAFVLNVLGFATDKDGDLAEKSNPEQKIFGKNGLPVKAKQFAGVKKGSIVVLPSDLPSLIDLANQLHDHQ